MRVQGLKRLALFAAILLTLNGCANPAFTQSFSNQVRVLDGIEIYSEDGERGLMFIMDASTTEKYCLAPSPDAVVSGAEGVGLTVAGKDTSTSLSNEGQIGTLGLGGRAPSILIAREILYRTCEFSLNYRLGKDEALAFYRENLEALQKLLPGQTEIGDASSSSSSVATGDIGDIAESTNNDGAND